MKINRFISMLATATLAVTTAVTFSACGGGGGGGGSAATNQQTSNVPIAGKTFKASGTLNNGSSVSVNVSIPTVFTTDTMTESTVDANGNEYNTGSHSYYVARGGSATISIGSQTYSGSAEVEYDEHDGGLVSIYITCGGKEYIVDFQVTTEGTLTSSYASLIIYESSNDEEEAGSGSLTNCSLY